MPCELSPLHCHSCGKEVLGSGGGGGGGGCSWGGGVMNSLSGVVCIHNMLLTSSLQKCASVVSCLKVEMKTGFMNESFAYFVCVYVCVCACVCVSACSRAGVCLCVCFLLFSHPFECFYSMTVVELFMLIFIMGTIIIIFLGGGFRFVLFVCLIPPCFIF